MLLGTNEAVCRERVGAERRRVTGWVLGCCSLLVPGSLLLQGLKIHFAHGSLVCPVLVLQLLRLLTHLTCRHFLHCTLHQDFVRIQGSLTEKAHPLARLLAGSYENCGTLGDTLMATLLSRDHLLPSLGCSSLTAPFLYCKEAGLPAWVPLSHGARFWGVRTIFSNMES